MARFVRRFTNLGLEPDAAIGAFADAVRKGAFPVREHLYGLHESLLSPNTAV